VIEIVRRRHIEARPEDLWPSIDDLDALGRWFSFADRFEPLEGSGAGRRQRLHGKWGRKRSEIDQVITAHEPNRELAWEHEAERLDGKPAPVFASSTRFSITIAPDGDGSLVTLRSQQVPASRPRGLVMRLFGTREVAQHMEKSLENLEATVGSTHR
jgi:uncharacterized protein YndB with AHSA1/START domain